jgi:hypothetical protein
MIKIERRRQFPRTLRGDDVANLDGRRLPIVHLAA